MLIFPKNKKEMPHFIDRSWDMLIILNINEKIKLSMFEKNTSIFLILVLVPQNLNFLKNLTMNLVFGSLLALMG